LLSSAGWNSTKNRRPTPRYDVGKTVKRDLTMAEHKGRWLKNKLIVIDLPVPHPFRHGVEPDDKRWPRSLSTAGVSSLSPCTLVT
jgi:hypothetical protein